MLMRLLVWISGTDSTGAWFSGFFCNNSHHFEETHSRTLNIQGELESTPPQSKRIHFPKRRTPRFAEQGLWEGMCSCFWGSV